VDNNILTDLYEIGRLDLLFSVFDRVSIPHVILETEILQGIREALAGQSFQISRISTEQGYEAYSTLTNTRAFRNLSHQDRVAISIARQHDYYCNSNDQLVRKACEKLDVGYIGILGIFDRAYHLDLFDRQTLHNLCAQLLSDETSCYMSKQVVESFLESISS
jgi:predicted nucleic acid-binding protein